MESASKNTSSSLHGHPFRLDFLTWASPSKRGLCLFRHERATWTEDTCVLVFQLRCRVSRSRGVQKKSNKYMLILKVWDCYIFGQRRERVSGSTQIQVKLSVDFLCRAVLSSYASILPMHDAQNTSFLWIIPMYGQQHFKRSLHESNDTM